MSGERHTNQAIDAAAWLPAATGPTGPAGTAAPGRRWALVTLALTAPFVATLLVTMWLMPYPISEAVALFEDVARASWSRFLVPDTSYFRPFFQLTLMAIWTYAPTITTKLALAKLVHLLPLLCLVPLFVAHLRPRHAIEAALAATAVAVVLGSPGFRDNLEVPLSYTAMAMPLSVLVWMLLERDASRWRSAVLPLSVVMAVGFKEQGLVLVPVVVLAWFTRAPGAGRVATATLVAATLAYIGFRLTWRAKWPVFEQSMGLWFSTLEPSEALVRFGDFPYPMYAYSALATMANVLFSEPTRGLFAFSRDIAYRQVETWALVNVLSSCGLTAVIGWWGATRLRETWRHGWSPESRAVLLLAGALLACGALSFNYSRDRLGGMAVVFYAGCGYLALRAAAAAALRATGRRRAALAALLVLLVVGWQIRAMGTIEHVRLTSMRNQLEWLVDLPARRLEFVDRPVYSAIMESMIEQGTVPSPPQPTRYPEWLARTFLPRP